MTFKFHYIISISLYELERGGPLAGASNRGVQRSLCGGGVLLMWLRSCMLSGVDMRHDGSSIAAKNPDYGTKTTLVAVLVFLGQ